MRYDTLSTDWSIETQALYRGVPSSRSPLCIKSVAWFSQPVAEPGQGCQILRLVKGDENVLVCESITSEYIGSVLSLVKT